MEKGCSFSFVCCSHQHDTVATLPPSARLMPPFSAVPAPTPLGPSPKLLRHQLQQKRTPPLSPCSLSSGGLRTVWAVPSPWHSMGPLCPGPGFGRLQSLPLCSPGPKGDSCFLQLQPWCFLSVPFFFFSPPTPICPIPYITFFLLKYLVWLLFC